MRRAVHVIAIIAVIAASAATVIGCGTGTAAPGATDDAAPSASPAAWTKVVELDGSLSGARRGRSGVIVELEGSALRFDITYGPAPGWGADHATLHWWLYPVSDSKIPLPAVPLRVVSKTHWRPNDSTTLRLETVTATTPGTYHLLYRGSGWYNMAIYQR
jgi:hypothetical protein